jgi:hypothetical protein
MSLMNSIDKNNLGPSLINFRLKDIPVVFLSYDEPNADENFERLQATHPNPSLVYRVHGVKGLDAAHKACAKFAVNDRFFTVDGDCYVDPAIWRQTLELPSNEAHATFSWSSRNVVNGLVYGNGGVKLWYAPYVLNMRTHEAASKDDNDNNVDFCWDFENYKQMNNTYGTVMNNATAFQAFRAGFREGVKMGLDQGHKVPVEDFNHKMYPGNYARWLIWMTVGRDVENGAWAIYGARLGAYNLYIENFDHSLISDYDWFNNYWKDIEELSKDPEEDSHRVLEALVKELDLPLVELDADQSRWFKHVNINPPKNFGWPAMLNHSALPLFGFTLPRY